MSRAIAYLGLGLTLVLSGAATAKDYNIKLHRPVVIGMRYMVNLELTRQNTSLAKVDGDSQKPEEITSVVSLIGTVEVLDVSAKGYPVSEEYSVAKCTQTVNKKTVDLVKPGTPLVVRLTPKGMYIDMDGEPLPLPIAEILNDLFVMTNGEITEDEVYGTSKTRAVGDTWALQAEGTDKFAKDSGFSTEGLTGKSLLVGVQKIAGADCLEISSTFVVPQVIPPEDSIPPKFKVQKATFKATNWGLYPADNVSLPPHEKTVTDTELTVVGSNGSQKIVSTTLGKQTRVIIRSPIPPPTATAKGTKKTTTK